MGRRVLHAELGRAEADGICKIVLTKIFIMASRDGATVAGTDGSDFNHRESIASQYKVSAQNKAYLSYALNFHLLATLCLLVKLSPAILDRMDIFILPLEELNIPKPLLWEWIWLASCFLIYVIGSNAIKASKVDKMNIFLIVDLLSFFVLLWGLGLHFPDAYAYMYEPHNKIYPTWKGYPVALLWYIFGIFAINIHLFEMYFGRVLKDAWSLKRKSN